MACGTSTGIHAREARRAPSSQRRPLSGAVVDGNGMYERRDPVVAPPAYVNGRT